jgi:hypothetical protein
MIASVVTASRYSVVSVGTEAPAVAAKVDSTIAVVTAAKAALLGLRTLDLLPLATATGRAHRRPGLPGHTCAKPSNAKAAPRRRQGPAPSGAGLRPALTPAPATAGVPTQEPGPPHTPINPQTLSNHLTRPHFFTDAHLAAVVLRCPPGRRCALGSGNRGAPAP